MKNSSKFKVQSSKVIVKQLQAGSIKDEFVISQDATIVLLAVSQTDYTLEIILNNKNTQVTILGIIIGQNADTITLHTLQKHAVGDTVSDLHIKSILTGRAQFFYEGSIQILKNAQRSNAYQRNDNLFLSDEAKAESKPMLEILANDVRCTHGATLGKIDEEQLFYLQSRGISKKVAEELIVSGFFQVLIDKIPDTSIQKEIIKIIQKELP